MEWGYHFRWLAGRYRVGFLQNGYAPISGPPLLTLDRTQRLLLDLELDARWQINKGQTLAAGGGVGVLNDVVDTTSMNGVDWTTVTDDRWHVRPLLGLTLQSLMFQITTTVYLGSNPEAAFAFGICWGRR
ncbi:MAG TPA: hypothetical protein VKZ18_22505 [Polyangia bacterium]|nr:hypothetical protein [Polyangia bacterium]